MYTTTYVHTMDLCVYLLVSVMFLRTISSSVMYPALQLPGSEVTDMIHKHWFVAACALPELEEK